MRLGQKVPKGNWNTGACEDMPGKLLGLTNRNTFAIHKRKNAMAACKLPGLL